MDDYYDRPWYVVLYPRPPPRQAKKQGLHADFLCTYTDAEPLPLLTAWRNRQTHQNWTLMGATTPVGSTPTAATDGGAGLVSRSRLCTLAIGFDSRRLHHPQHPSYRMDRRLRNTQFR